MIPGLAGPTTLRPEEKREKSRPETTHLTDRRLGWLGYKLWLFTLSLVSNLIPLHHILQVDEKQWNSKWVKAKSFRASALGGSKKTQSTDLKGSWISSKCTFLPVQTEMKQWYYVSISFPHRHCAFFAYSLGIFSLPLQTLCFAASSVPSGLACPNRRLRFLGARLFLGEDSAMPAFD